MASSFSFAFRHSNGVAAGADFTHCIHFDYIWLVYGSSFHLLSEQWCDKQNLPANQRMRRETMRCV
jgi:hypothetical protein